MKEDTKWKGRSYFLGKNVEILETKDRYEPPNFKGS
jgi:hypothetical protein